MFFALSKLLSFLINPLVIVFLFIVASFIIKKQKLKKLLFWTGFSLLFFFSNDFIANEAMAAWEPLPTPYASIHKQYDCGIVLTGVTQSDRQPADRVYFNHGADRVTHAVELYKKGIIKKILISGGVGRLVTKGSREADDLFRVMVMMGVPEQDMLVENESQNTHESAVRVHDILKSDTGDFLLITSAFHMYRSKACFSKEGLPVDTFSVDFYSHPRSFTPEVLFVPKSDAILVWQKLFKEWTGLIAYKLVGYI